MVSTQFRCTSQNYSINASSNLNNGLRDIDEFSAFRSGLHQPRAAPSSGWRSIRSATVLPQATATWHVGSAPLLVPLVRPARPTLFRLSFPAIESYRHQARNFIRRVADSRLKRGSINSSFQCPASKNPPIYSNRICSAKIKQQAPTDAG